MSHCDILAGSSRDRAATIGQWHPSAPVPPRQTGGGSGALRSIRVARGMRAEPGVKLGAIHRLDLDQTLGDGGHGVPAGGE